MKKVLASAFLAAVVMVSSLTVAHADLISTILENAILWCVRVEEVNSNEDEWVAARDGLDTIWRSSPNGVVKVSYDVLSSAAMELNTNGIPCALQQFSVGSTTGYFIRGTGRIPMSNGYTYDLSKRCFCDGSGAAYYAEAPSPGTVTPTPGPDYSDDIAGISDNLDMLPIMAQIMIEIVNTQLDTWDWYKMIVEGIWDIGDTLDSFAYNISYGSSLLSAINVRLSNLYSYMVESIGARVTDISGQLDSVIVDDKLQVNTSPIESRLDRLIGLYSEVNSVSFDTVDIGYGITDAVGGELKDVVFWGYSDGTSVGSGIRYTLDGVVYHPEVTLPNGGTFVLRSIKLGTSIPDDISSNPALMEGVWQSGRNYYLSDTYAIGTGIYSQRIDVDSSGNWVAASSVFYETLRKWSISVPAGDTSIFAGYALRITGKYDKVGGVTKTADIITAINNINIPAFDDSGVIAAINNIPAYDDSGLVSAVTTVSDQITEHFGQYDAPYVFPNLIHNMTSSKYINGVSSSAFADVPANSRLLYSTSSSIYSGGKSGTTGTPGATGSASWTIKPTYSTASGFGYSFGYSRNMGTLNTGSSAVVYSMSQTVSFNDFGGASRSFRLSFNARHHPRTYSATASLTIYPRWDDSGVWLGWYNGSTLLSETGEPSRRLLTAPPEAGSYYIYGTTDSGIDVVYASRFTGFLQSQSDRVVNAIGSISQPIDYTAQLTAVADKLDTLISQSSDTVVNVVTNNTYITNVYQLDDENDVADRSKEGIEKIGGVFKWLWKHAFKDAFGAADVTKLDGLL